MMQLNASITPKIFETRKYILSKIREVSYN